MRVLGLLASLLLAVPSLAADAPVVAVVPLADASGDPALAPLGTGLADMLLTDLVQRTDLVLVERSRLRAVLDELELGRSAFVDARTAQKLGRGLGAAYLVTGSFAVSGDALRLDVRVVDVGSGKVVLARSEQGSRDDVLAVEAALVEALAGELQQRVEQGRRTGTVSLDALVLYGEGLEALDDDRTGVAKVLLGAALADAPGLAGAKLRLDEVEATLGAALRDREAAQIQQVRSLLGRLRQGDAAACVGLQQALSSLVGPLAVGYRGLYTIAVMADVEGPPELLERTVTDTLDRWQQLGLEERPDDVDGLAAGLGRRAGTVWLLTGEILESAIAPELCSPHPHEAALGTRLMLLGYAQEGADDAGRVMAPLVGPTGDVVLAVGDLDAALIQTADAYVRRYPAGGSVPMVRVWVLPALRRERQRR